MICLDYGMHPLNVDDDVLEMAKYVKDNKIILVYVEHKSSNVYSSIFVTPKKRVAIAADNHLRKVSIEIDSSPGVNRNLTPMCHRNLTKEWEREHDLDIIDYNSFGSDLDDGIDSERGIQLRELRRIGKEKNQGSNKYYFYLERVRVRYERTIPALVPYVSSDIDMGKTVFSQTKGGPVIRKNDISGKQIFLGKDKIVQGKGIWEVRILIEDHSCLQSREIKACTSRFHSDHVMKTLATIPDIPVRVVQDQMNKQFDVEVSKMQDFRAKRIATDKMTSSFREHYSLLREYAQELIKKNPGMTVRIDVQQEPNPDSLTRTFRWVSLARSNTNSSWVDANNGVYPIAYAIVEAKSKRLIQAIAYVFPSVEHMYCVRHIHEIMKSQFKGDKAKCDLLLNNIRENGGHLYQVIGPYRDQCVVNMDRRVCSYKKWELSGIPCKHDVDAIYNMSENGMGVGIPEHWVHAAYRLET
ncbi:hypothetical protein Tco_0526650 [Tanacetum coccineum]